MLYWSQCVHQVSVILQFGRCKASAILYLCLSCNHASNQQMQSDIKATTNDYK